MTRVTCSVDQVPGCCAIGVLRSFDKPYQDFRSIEQAVNEIRKDREFKYLLATTIASQKYAIESLKKNGFERLFTTGSNEGRHRVQVWGLKV